MMLQEMWKPLLTYGVSIVLAHVAQRYHLTGDQITAIMADVGTAVAALAGVWAHKAAFMAPAGGKTNA